MSKWQNVEEYIASVEGCACGIFWFCFRWKSSVPTNPNCQQSDSYLRLEGSCWQHETLLVLCHICASPENCQWLVKIDQEVLGHLSVTGWSWHSSGPFLVLCHIPYENGCPYHPTLRMDGCTQRWCKFLNVKKKIRINSTLNDFKQLFSLMLKRKWILKNDGQSLLMMLWINCHTLSWELNLLMKE